MAEEVVKKSLRYSIYDGAAFALMDGMTTSFLTPFAVALNASVNLIAALTYVPQLIGAFMQLFATKIVEVFRDRRKIIVIGAFFQGILWIPLLLLPYLTPNQKYLLVVYVTAQTVFAQVINPVWNSLMGDLVPKYERGRYFGFRNKIVGIASFISTFLAGLILNYFSTKNPFIGFSILFGIAFATRMLSVAFLAVMRNPLADLEHAEKFSLIDFVKKMDKTNYGHFVIYASLFKFTVNIAAPFFAVYMIRDLGLSYFQFAILMSAELIANFFAMGAWGKLMDERGTKLVLYISGMLTPIVPLLWLFSSEYYYLIFIQALAGVAWAGFNLSSSNFIFDAVRAENRVRCIAYFRFFEGVAVFAGAALGGVLVSKLPAWIFVSSIPMVFLISGILRFVASIMLLPTLKEARLIEVPVRESFFKRFLAIRPSEGIVVEVLGRYNKIKETVKKTPKKIIDVVEKNIPSPKETKEYTKRLIKTMEKIVMPKKEQHDLTDMHDIEHITEEIEKGKVRK